MRGAAPIAVAFSLIAAAGPAAPQSPAPPQPSAQTPAQPQPQPPGRTTAPRESGLNLKLDEADLRSLSRDPSAPRDQAGGQATGGLPSLGENARTLERAPSTGRSNPYPADTDKPR